MSRGRATNGTGVSWRCHTEFAYLWGSERCRQWPAAFEVAGCHLKEQKMEVRDSLEGYRSGRTRVHYGADGARVGNSQPASGTRVDHYDTSGARVGWSEVGSDGGVRHYDNDGKSAGRSEAGKGGDTVHVDRDGKSSGSSTDKGGGTAVHRDADGKSAGSSATGK